MEALSKRYLPDSELRSPLAKLFRGLLNQMHMNPSKWTRLLSDYLRWVVTIDDEEKARQAILMKSGNIKDTYFHNPKLTADKFFEGLSILQMEECEITIKVKDAKGDVYIVTEKRIIKHAKNSEYNEVDEQFPDRNQD